MRHILLLVCAWLVCAAAPSRALGDTEASAWSAALALKQASSFEAAARAFETFQRDHPESAHADEALVEAGVCWFSIGRARQVLQRNNDASLAAFRQGLAFFERVTTETPNASVAGRAQYMRGSVRLFMGEFAAAEREYSTCFEKYAADPKYAAKALERRASVRRHLLRTHAAQRDLELYLQRFPQGEDVELVRLHKGFAATYGQDAPPLDVEAWVQGQGTTLESLRGEVVALYFFASWCDNCEKARPFMLDLFARYEQLGVRMIGVVNKSQGQTIDSVRAFVLQEGYRMPVLMDAGGTNARYASAKIPHLVLIDRVGRVRWRDNPGNFHDATLEALLVEDPAVPLSK